MDKYVLTGVNFEIGRVEGNKIIIDDDEIYSIDEIKDFIIKDSEREICLCTSIMIIKDTDIENIPVSILNINKVEYLYNHNLLKDYEIYGCVFDGLDFKSLVELTDEGWKIINRKRRKYEKRSS